VLTTGAVSKAVDSGFIWDNPKTSLPTGMTTRSINVVSANNIIVGGMNGEVAYSTDGNVSWTKVSANIPAGGNTIAVADKLATGGNIYAVSTSNGGYVYRFTIGTSTSWTPMMATALMSNGSAAVATGIAFSSGTLYVTALSSSGIVTTPPGLMPGITSTSSLYRTLVPSTAALDSDWSVISIAKEITSASLTNTQGAYNLVFTIPVGAGEPNDLAVTVGADKNPKLWALSFSTSPSSYAVGFPPAGSSPTTQAIPAGYGNIFASRTALESFVDTLTTTSPALTAPADAFIDQINTANGGANNVVFNWNAVTGTDPATTTYKIQIALDSAFTQLILPGGGLAGIATMPAIIGPTGTTAVFPFQADTTYYWRVRIDGPIASPYSASRSFKIAPLAPLAIVSPASGANGIPINPTFVWSPVTGATTYEVIVSDDPTFKIITFSRTTDKPEFAADEQLAYGTVYYWRVRASAPATSVTPFINGIFTTVGKPAPPTSAVPPVTITSVPPPTVTVNLPPPVEAIPSYLLWIIIGIGAILVIALIVLVVRTRRTS
jgi:hypothetical protein